MAVGQVQTGMASTIKSTAENAAKATEKAMAEAAVEASDMAPKKGQILYTVNGYPVFNTFTPSGDALNFTGGAYMLELSDTKAKEVKDYLQHFVDNGTLSMEVGEEE